MSAIANTKKPRKKLQAVLLHPFNCFNLAAGKKSDSFFTPEYTSQLRFFFVLRQIVHCGYRAVCDSSKLKCW